MWTRTRRYSVEYINCGVEREETVGEETQNRDVWGQLVRYLDTHMHGNKVR